MNVDVLPTVLTRCFCAPHEYRHKFIAFCNRGLALGNITHSPARDDLQPDHCCSKFLKRNFDFVNEATGLWWDAATCANRLKLVIQLRRFLTPHEAHCPNLASCINLNYSLAKALPFGASSSPQNFIRRCSSGVEQLIRNEQVVGSNPTSGSIFSLFYKDSSGLFRKCSKNIIRPPDLGRVLGERHPTCIISPIHQHIHRQH